MRFDIHVHHHFDPLPATTPPQPGIADVLAALAEVKALMSQRTDELQAALAANQSATQSAIDLINGLADQIEAANGDATEIARITADFRGNAERLAAAVVENTPAAPTA